MTEFYRMTDDQRHKLAGDVSAVLEPVATGSRQFREQLSEVLRPLGAALRPLAEYIEAHPELVEQLRAEREAADSYGSCHCLCQVTHGSLGVCTGVAEPGLTLLFASQALGTTHVPFCGPCWEARAQRVTA